MRPTPSGSKTRVNNLMQRAPIGQGEAEALARALGIEHVGTLMVPYEAVIKGLIRYNELVSILSDPSKVLKLVAARLPRQLLKARASGA